MSRLTLVLSAPLLFVLALPAQQPAPPSSTSSAYAAIPVKATPESLEHAKKWWTLDCVMCHGKIGDGKGETAQEMKLKLVDFTDPATLKDRTDGEIYYIIKNGHSDMPPEGQRIKTEEGWDLVNYVRSLAKPKASTDQKPQ